MANRLIKHIQAKLEDATLGEVFDIYDNEAIHNSDLSNGTYGFVTPEMFGAVGDGVTDDSDAVEAASRVGILKGGNKDHVYYISKPCTIYNGAVSCRFKVSISVYALRIKGLVFSDNEITNDYEAYEDDLGRGFVSLLINGEKNLTINNNYFHDMYNVMDIIDCDSINISNNIFENVYSTTAGISAGGNGYGLLVYNSKNISICNNTFTNVYRHSIYVSVSNSAPENVDYNIKISNNIFTSPSVQAYESATGYEASIRVRSAYGCSIEGNTFYKVIECASFTSQENDSVESEAIYNVFKNNYILDVERITPQQRALVDVTADNDTFVKNLVIDGNIINNVAIPLVIPDHTENTVIKNNYLFTDAVSDNDAIVKTNIDTRNLILIGNTFKTNGVIFRFYSSGLYLDLENNIFEASYFSPTQISSSVTSAKIRNNNVVTSNVNDASYTDALLLQNSFDYMDFDSHISANNVDVETLATGMYWIRNGTNLPSESSTYGFLIVFNDGNTYSRLVFYPYNNNNVYIRYKNITWGDWTKFSGTNVAI